MSALQTTTILPNETVVNASQRDDRLDSLVDKAQFRGQVSIIYRGGKPKAVLIPMRNYEAIRQKNLDGRKEFLRLSRGLRDAASDLSDTELDALAQRAIEDVRAEMTQA